MINLYAYTYPSATKLFDDYILTKVGDSIRDVKVRMNEQGGAAEYESKMHVGAWNNLQVIQRDYDVHKVLTKEGLHHTDGKGTEWFKIPGKTTEEAYTYIDKLVAQFEGKRIRNKVKLRKLQQKALDDAMNIIANGGDIVTVIANLCPRFGKTIWALMLFNAISEQYGNRVMLLPAYWLSVHSSFVDELEQFDDFLDIAMINPNKEGAEQAAVHALDNNQRIIIPVSLHGDYDDWAVKHDWIAKISNDDIFMFADEGDFGTHADNQKKKLDFIFA
jgi:hypothetical protein|tara:strand:- start:3611 stop:4435 length:825 start_codon:yes stop_codon:yes gene_type:complete